MIYAPGPSRRRAFAEDSDRIGAPEPALFLDVTAPVPFARAEGFWIPGLIDELNYYLSPLRSCTPNYDFVPKKLYDIYLTQDS